jgi:hypothetical protein
MGGSTTKQKWVVGLCRCGCGKKTKIANQDSKWGVKGKPNRYLLGHNGRGKVKTGGLVRDPNLRFVDNNGYVRVRKTSTTVGYDYEHVCIAERALGKLLPVGAQVHHFNGNTQDNTNTNLVICQDTAYHRLIHIRTAAYRNCGHAGWRRCYLCKQWDDTLAMSRHKRAFQHRACVLKYRRELYKRKKEKRIGKFKLFGRRLHS